MSVLSHTHTQAGLFLGLNQFRLIFCWVVNHEALGSIPILEPKKELLCFLFPFSFVFLYWYGPETSSCATRLAHMARWYSRAYESTLLSSKEVPVCDMEEEENITNAVLFTWNPKHKAGNILVIFRFM